MEFLELQEGDKVQYVGQGYYGLANGQEVFEEGDELLINSNVNVQKKFFKTVEEQKPQKVEKTLEEMNKEELITFAEKNNIDVDKRKGEEKILAEIKAELDK